MKKLSILLGLAAVALGITATTGCSEDRDPVYKAPTKYVMNTPALQDMYVALNDHGTLDFPSSQPDYGFAAVAQYALQVSLTEDFAAFETLQAKTPTQAVITVSQADLSVALCSLHGIKDLEGFKAVYGSIPSEKVFFRGYAEIPGVEGSGITSNVVYLSQVMPYFAVPVPGFIYLIGTPNGWPTPDASQEATLAPWRLFEPDNGIGSHIYSGVFEVPAAPVFRFYTELTGWDGGASMGYQEADEATDFPDAFAAGSFASAIVKGKGSFSFPDFGGGKMTIVVDLNENTMTITLGEASIVVPRYIYLVGSPEGWAGPTEDNADHYADWRLVDRSESGIYTGSFNIAATDNLVFRFYTALGSWDENSLGMAAPDQGVECQFSNGVWNSPYVEGKGSWMFGAFDGGTIDMTVDTNNKTVNFVVQQ